MTTCLKPIEGYGKDSRALVIVDFEAPGNTWTNGVRQLLENAGFQVEQVVNKPEEIAKMKARVCCLHHAFHLIIFNGQGHHTGDMPERFLKNQDEVDLSRTILSTG